MPGLDLSQLSSNWKRLQEKLQLEKKQEPKKNDLKRKRLDGKGRSVNGFKEVKLSDTTTERLRKGEQMGLNGSKNGQRKGSGIAHSNLAKQFGVSQEDISAAYGTTTEATRKHVDDVNGGIHPTHKLGKYVAMDCEMVGTGPPPHEDNVLARVSFVNFHGEQIYDSYVLPPPQVKVEDYRTFVSGIKPSHLVKGYARPLAEVQKDVAGFLDGRILVGHALWNDFQALLLSHPKRDLRDTSRHPKFRIDSKGRPPALRHLAKSELGLEIQAGEHSSIEDARAAMMLFKKEKVGFEEENRKRFGRHAKVESTDVKKGRTNAVGKDGLVDGKEVESDDEDDLQLLDGEEYDEVVDEEAPADQTPKVTVKKKRKKKKRTKRK